ncbi:DUF3141 domain-containing protein [Actibacterium sp. D379-3]
MTQPKDTSGDLHGKLAEVADIWQKADAQVKLLGRLGARHGTELTKTAIADWSQTVSAAQTLITMMDPLTMSSELRAYLGDFQQRGILFLDALRQRSDAALAREAEGLKPVLVFDYEMVVDGSTLERPVNYSLVRIRPPAGFPPTREDGRPWVIIDPRAGHGSGIGGFKAESEVGVALRDGHPVYFVIFFPHPEPDQTLADVCEAEAIFLRRIAALHPASPKPLITGNCQGGWAAMILAATHPDLTGPLVIAGAPLSYWAGEVGKNPFRYYGGLAGGAMPALLASDLGGGTFDGASLVLNFEGLNPAKTWWRKNYDLFADIDGGTERFLDFERWWSGFYFMNEAEIRWIVENLFIGNKLTRGQAVLNDGTPVDLTRITAPVVVFASHGDNITPPQQALHWIADLYDTTEELRARGHVIVYTLHDSVGHLGIFVSAKVATTQHKQITSVVKTIESLAPGLYEMIIGEDETGFQVAFEARGIEQIRAMSDGPEIEEEFSIVSELSDWGTKTYELTLRPWLNAIVTPELAEMGRALHPMRQQMALFSTTSPAMENIRDQAQVVRARRRPAPQDNMFKVAEHAFADLVEQGWDFYRDSRDAAIELGFHALYASPWMRGLAKAAPHTPAAHDISRFPEVRDVLSHVDRGDYPEAIVRMMILLARARGSVRRERLERSNAMLHSRPPFDTMSAEQRNHLIHEQSLIVDLAGKQAIQTLPKLLRDDVDRLRAINLVLDVAGPVGEMDPATIAMFEQFQTVLRTRAKNWQNPVHGIAAS